MNDQIEPKTAIDIQREAREFVEREVYCNVGQFMDFCIKMIYEHHSDDNPITEDEVDFREDPSEWDAKQCHEYIKDTFGETWESIAGEIWEYAQREDKLDAVRAYIEAEGDELAITAFSEVLFLDHWTPEMLDTFLSAHLPKTWEDLTGYDFEETVQEVAEYEDLDDEIEKVKEYIRDNADPREPYEWWAVSHYFGDQLKRAGDIVIDMGGGLNVWGRETTGQAIYMDGGVQEIVMARLRRQGSIE